MKAELRDPDSARFSEVEHCGKSDIITGKLNAKNRFGAMEGEVTFYSDGAHVSVWPAAKPDGPFTDLFVEVYGNDGTKLVNACTAAERAQMSPEARADFDKSTGWSDKGPPGEAFGTAFDMNATDMNATDMNATDVSAASDTAAAPPTDDAGAADEPESSARPARSKSTAAYPNNCYKDYCPCEPPQGGGDSILCDQLEAGQDVDINLMIAGRGMREARRQMETGDY